MLGELWASRWPLLHNLNTNFSLLCGRTAPLLFLSCQDCAADLAAAKPIVDAALAALNMLDKGSLTELKSMGKPPDDVVMVPKRQR